MLTRFINTPRERFVVLGLWTALVVAVGAFHHRRSAVLYRQWCDGGILPFYPVWLLAVDVLLIAAGFGLLSVKAIAGSTRHQRFDATFWVGFVCLAAVGNLVFDAWRQLLDTILN